MTTEDTKLTFEELCEEINTDPFIFMTSLIQRLAETGVKSSKITVIKPKQEDKILTPGKTKTKSTKLIL